MDEEGHRSGGEDDQAEAAIYPVVSLVGCIIAASSFCLFGRVDREGFVLGAILVGFAAGIVLMSHRRAPRRHRIVSLIAILFVAVVFAYHMSIAITLFLSLFISN